MSLTGQNAVTSTIAGSATDASVSLTVPANTKWLVLKGYGDSNNVTVPTPSKMSWNGVNATFLDQVPSDAGGTGYLMYRYLIQNPTAGTGNVLFQINSTIAKWVCAECIVSTNAVSYVAGAYSYATSLTPSCTVASSAGQLVISGLGVNNKLVTEITETSGQSVETEIGDAGFGYGCIDKFTSAGNSVTTTWTVTSGATGTQRWSAASISFLEASGTFDSFGGGTVKRGQTNVPYTTTSLTPSITSITTNTSGVTVSNIADSGGDGTCTVSDFTEGAYYPALPATVDFTANAANGSATIVGITVDVQTNEVKQTLNTPIYNDNTYLGYYLDQAGHTPVNGELLYYIPVNNAVIGQDTGITIDSAGTFPVWHRTLTGLMYKYNVTVNEYGDVIGVSKSQLQIGFGIGFGI